MAIVCICICGHTSHIMILQIAVCEMERTRGGGFKKVSDYIEVLADSTDSYSSVLLKACNTLGLEVENAVLVRVSGYKIPNQPLVVEGYSTPWTLGQYIKSAFARASSTRFGILCNEVILSRSSV